MSDKEKDEEIVHEVLLPDNKRNAITSGRFL